MDILYNLRCQINSWIVWFDCTALCSITLVHYFESSLQYPQKHGVLPNLISPSSQLQSHLQIWYSHSILTNFHSVLTKSPRL